MTLTFLTSVVTAWVSALPGPSLGRPGRHSTNAPSVRWFRPCRHGCHDRASAATGIPGSPTNNLCHLKESEPCPDFNGPRHALECPCKSEDQQGAGEECRR